MRCMMVMTTTTARRPSRGSAAPAVSLTPTAGADLSDAGGRPRNPSVTAAVLATIAEVIAREGFWAPATIADAIGWDADVLERVSARHRKLKRLRARAKASLLAKLGEVLTRKALGGDRGAAVMVLKEEFGWAGSRDPGGVRVSESKLGGLFDDLDGHD